ncbi:hypothetical protein ACMFMF_011730 [Clarireedia jacksonii]
MKLEEQKSKKRKAEKPSRTGMMLGQQVECKQMTFNAKSLLDAVQLSITTVVITLQVCHPRVLASSLVMLLQTSPAGGQRAENQEFLHSMFIYLLITLRFKIVSALANLDSVSR